MNICSTCQFPYREGDRYCGQCGATLPGNQPVTEGGESTYVMPTPNDRTWTSSMPEPTYAGSGMDDLTDATMIVGDRTLVVAAQPAAEDRTYIVARQPNVPGDQIMASPLGAPAPHTPLRAAACPTGHPLTEPGATYCGMCGAPVGGAPPLAPAPASRPDGTVLQAPAMSLVHLASGQKLTIAPGARVLCLGAQVDVSHGDWDLWALTGSSAVSRRHALLMVSDAGAVSIMDAGSRNGTFVNGVRLAPLTPRPLTPQDTVTLGQGDQVAFQLR
jgi:hypothetical protein